MWAAMSVPPLPSRLQSAVAPWALFGLSLASLPACGPSAPALPPPPAPAQLAGGLEPATLSKLNAATDKVNANVADAGGWAALGRAYEEAQVHEGASTAFSSAAELRPTDAKLWYRAAIAAGRLGELDLALTRLARVHELEPSYGPAWRRRGTWLLDLARAPEARDAFERAGALLPSTPDAPIGLARAALAEDEVTAALTHARTAYERAPSDPYVRLILGNCLRRAGEAEEALPHLEAGQGARPRYVDPWSEGASGARRKDDEMSERASQLAKEKRWPEAVEVLKELAAARPEDGGVSVRLGVALISADRPADALAHYEKAIVQFPGNYNIATAHAAALRAAGRTAKSLSAIQTIINRWPERAAAYLQRGSTLAAMGDVPAARQSFQRASALNPSDLRGPLFEGQLLAKVGRYPEAAGVLRAGLELPGASPPLVYFKMLLSAQAAARMGPDVIQETLDRARVYHGDEADSLTRKQ